MSSAVTVRNPDLKTEEDFRKRLSHVQGELSAFRRRSHPATRTPELWDRFQALQATAAWLEESLAVMQRHRKPARKSRRTVWESLEEEEDER